MAPYAIIFSTYLLTLVGNGLCSVTAWSSQHLQTLLYFFFMAEEKGEKERLLTKGSSSKGLSQEQPVPLGTGNFHLLDVSWTVLEAEVIGLKPENQGMPGGQWLKLFLLLHLSNEEGERIWFKSSDSTRSAATVSGTNSPISTRGHSSSFGEVPTSPLVASGRTPELDTVLQVGSHQSGVEGQNHHPQPAGHGSFDAAQETVGFLGCERILPAHVQLFMHQYPKVLCRAALNPFIPQPVLILEVVLTQVQDLALGLVEPHEVHMGPILKLVQVPLDGIPSLRRVNHTSQHSVVCKLAEGALNPSVCVID
ncbi:hypothetical protein QYF61_022397 [Mycteria americana]|uniref:Uncharacterized protein n=1 Tax=Mycteria americana TaxID=33587 RepID=A0AAN7RGE3_MYCAM|nr:hypothetical protein QYF61_022397 [Mycteria americana]